MSDVKAIADRFEIEALRGEFTDAAMMRDYDRLASLFTEGRGRPDPPHRRRGGNPRGDPRRRLIRRRRGVG
jgi:hypothetical protein